MPRPDPPVLLQMPQRALDDVPLPVEHAVVTPETLPVLLRRDHGTDPPPAQPRPDPVHVVPPVGQHPRRTAARLARALADRHGVEHAPELPPVVAPPGRAHGGPRQPPAVGPAGKLGRKTAT